MCQIGEILIFILTKNVFSRALYNQWRRCNPLPAAARRGAASQCSRGESGNNEPVGWELAKNKRSSHFIFLSDFDEQLVISYSCQHNSHSLTYTLMLAAGGKTSNAVLLIFAITVLERLLSEKTIDAEESQLVINHTFLFFSFFFFGSGILQ